MRVRIAPRQVPVAKSDKKLIQLRMHGGTSTCCVLRETIRKRRS